ncbi:MAG: VWA domain-containing protein [Planctomycetes bacterium]|nr:VWA domain-containing protein [Planctomycetota bacterium]
MTLDELFVHAEALPIVLLAPLAYVVLRRRDGARARRLARALGPRADVLASESSASQRRWRRATFALGLLFALLAALQPTWGEEARPRERRGADVVVCLDVSRSMLARDVVPDRLGAAVRGIAAMAERARGDRLALVAFAGDATLLVPLTHDVTTFTELLANADPTVVTRGGTDLGTALRVAQQALDGSDRAHATVVVVTDGEDHGGTGRNVAGELSAQGIAVHCAGIGKASGSKIVIDEAGAGAQAFLRTRDGDEVVSAMDRAGLTAIADAGGGVFVDATANGALAFVDLWTDHVVPRARSSIESDDRRDRAHRYQSPLLVAWLLWSFGLALTGRALGRRSRTTRRAHSATATARA